MGLRVHLYTHIHMVDGTKGNSGKDGLFSRLCQKKKESPWKRGTVTCSSGQAPNKAAQTAQLLEEDMEEVFLNLGWAKIFPRIHKQLNTFKKMTDWIAPKLKTFLKYLGLKTVAWKHCIYTEWCVLSPSLLLPTQQTIWYISYLYSISMALVSLSHLETVQRHCKGCGGCLQKALSILGF